MMLTCFNFPLYSLFNLRALASCRFGYQSGHGSPFVTHPEASISHSHIFTAASGSDVGSSSCPKDRRPALFSGRFAWTPTERLAWVVQRAPFSTSELRTGMPASCPEEQYSFAADNLLDSLHDKLEAYLEDLDLSDSDVEYSQGVLTVNLGTRLGTYVINKQVPNQQIWLSSPVSGPFRYDLTPKGRWVYSRDDRDLLKQLEGELEALTGVEIRLG